MRMERVKVLYEQYFMGIEKIEPGVARKDIARHMIILQQQYIRNTGLRFRFNTMLQKWNIYVTYWNRVLREIENGTYTRHIQKAARRAQSEGRELPREMLPPPQRGSPGESIGEPMQRMHDDDSWPGVPTGTSAPAVEDHRTEPGFERIQPVQPLFPPPPPKDAPAPPKRVAPPPPPATPEARAAAVLRPPPPPAAPAASIPGMNEEELRALHKRFVATRAMNGETARVSYETLVNSLSKQVPRVLQQPGAKGAKGVRFEVAVQNGRAILKAIPTK
jgi:hypothetical protein